MNKVKILSMGQYLPENIVFSEEFDKKFNLELGTAERKTGIKKRHYVKNETLAYMGAKAAVDAIEKANINLKDIDCIISASGVGQQPIPSTASLFQKELGLEDSGIPCFDINATCLSFVVALDTISYLVNSRKYKNVLIISSDIASVGINENDFKSSILFGDGACAAILQPSSDNETSKIMDFSMHTYSKGADYTCIKGGCSLIHAREYNEKNKEDFLFHMDGLKVYELASKYLKTQVGNFLKKNQTSFDEIKLVVPHQAGAMAMKLVQRKLKVPKGKFLYCNENTGNTIASSIPLGLKYAIDNNLIKRGDKIMLLGTSAGLSIGVMLLEY